jgi:hypothetical protein
MALVNQPTAAPTNKVAAVGIGGSIATILVFIAGQFGVDVTPEVSAAFVVVVTFLSGYIKRDKVV